MSFKALFYKENDFLMKNNFEFSNYEDLLDLYYELKFLESVIGFLKLADKNRKIQIEKMKTY